MSSATDLHNDVFTQGTGLVDSFQAVRNVNGHAGTFTVQNSGTSQNIESILRNSIENVNSTAFGFEKFSIPTIDVPQTSWFGGRLVPGESSTTTFTITNPTNKTLEISITPQKLELIEEFTLDGTTKTHLKDSILNTTKTYRPNYIPIANFTSNNFTTQDLESQGKFPGNSSL